MNPETISSPNPESGIDLTGIDFKASLVYKGTIAPKGYIFYICTKKINHTVWSRKITVDRFGLSAEDEVKAIKEFKKSFYLGLKEKLRN